MEMLVAAAVFASSVMILLGIFPLSARAVRQSQLNLIATHLAENQLETARARSYEALFTESLPAIPFTLKVNGTDLNVTYNVTMDVTEVNPGLKSVRVTVSWHWEFDRNLTLETEIARTAP
ncbi:hypothetical protein DYH09_09005 [bacterium CPR1]|nr:hypothetical protein [bacterium CPR1]